MLTNALDFHLRGNDNSKPRENDKLQSNVALTRFIRAQKSPAMQGFPWSVTSAAQARRKFLKKRSVQIVHEHSEETFNTA